MALSQGVAAAAHPLPLLHCSTAPPQRELFLTNTFALFFHVQIMEETGQQAQPRAPPASKKAVASLPKEALTEARLRELGGPDVRCPVCMCVAAGWE